MAILWRELSDVRSSKAAAKRFGTSAAQWVQAREAGRELPRTWLLDRRAFRAAVAKSVPPGHDVFSIAAERSAARRSEKAARAYQRLAASADSVPVLDLPEGAGRLLVWGSVVTKPGSVELPSLAACVEIDSSEELADAVAAIWARVYFERALEEVVEAGVVRLEIAVGVTPLAADQPDEERGFIERLCGVPSAPTDAQSTCPGWSTGGGTESALCISLGRRAVSRWNAALAESWGRVPQGLFRQRPSGWKMEVPVAARYIDRQSGLERVALASFLEPAPERELRGGAPSRSVLGRGRDLGRVVRVWGACALRGARLAPRVAEHERSVQEATAGLDEMDLALLPDDGLKRTLEAMVRCFEEAQQLRVETSAVVEQLTACVGMVAPGAELLVDAGLENLPSLAPLSAWEQCLSVLRAHEAARRALGDGCFPPDGPGARALQRFGFDHPVLGLGALDPARPRLTESPEQMVAWAGFGLVKAVDAAACRRVAGFAADRMLAADERRRSRGAALSMGALRASTRDAITLRERVRAAEMSIAYMLRRIASDIDGRLRRIEPRLPRGSAFDCSVHELLEAVDLRGRSLEARVAWRRAERTSRRLERRLRRPGEAGEGPLSGAALAPGHAEGVLTPFDGRRRTASGGGSQAEVVLWVEHLDPLLVLALPYVAGVVTKEGRLGDSAAVAARVLGKPLLRAVDVPEAWAGGLVRLDAEQDDAALRLDSSAAENAVRESNTPREAPVRER